MVAAPAIARCTHSPLQPGLNPQRTFRRSELPQRELGQAALQCAAHQGRLSTSNRSGWRFELPLAAWHRTARWPAALLAIPPPLDLGPFAEIAPHGRREGLDGAGVLAAIPRRGGGRAINPVHVV